MSDQGLAEAIELKHLSTPAQKTVATGALLLVAALAYVVALKHFLHGLENPWPYEMTYGTLLFWSVFHTLRMKTKLRNRAIHVIEAVATISIGLWLASYVRHAYIDFLHAIYLPQIGDLFGKDYEQALSNRVVGFDGSFGLAMLFTRMALAHRVGAWLFRLLAVNDGNVACPACGRVLGSG